MIRYPAALGLLIGLLFGPVAFSAPPAPMDPDKDRPSAVLLREVYVPYEVFHSLKEQQPDGVVMNLAEYRQLVLEAERQSRTTGEVELPPLGASVISATYQGRVQTGGRGLRSARFDVHLQIQVARDGWVFCDLGTQLPALGSVTVSGEPGWLVVGTPHGASGRRGTKQRASHGVESHTYLVLKGQGTHGVELSFVARVVDGGEESIITSPLFQAASATLELVVPGRASGTAEPDVLGTTASDATTRFRLALGEARQFRLAWRGRKTVDENPVLLAAEHSVSLLPRIGSPLFAWQAALRIGRQKTDTLLLTEAPGMIVLNAQGELVHSWQRTDAGLRIILKEPVTGLVTIRLDGLYALDDGRFSLAAPGLAGAFSNRGYLALYTPPGEIVAVSDTRGLEEISPAEGDIVPLSGSEIARVFRFATGDARLDGTSTPTPTRFETRGAYLLSATESNATLLTRARVEVSAGRLYALSVSLPQPWSLATLRAEGPNGEALQFSYEEIGPPDARQIRVELGRATSAERPVQLVARFEHSALAPDRAWDQRQLTFSLPVVEGAARVETSLGIALSSSLDLETTNLPEWRSLPPQDGRAEELEAAGRVVALLETDVSAPTLDVTLAHRRARGEYRSVTHVLAAENQLRVRVDLRLAVVDRGVDALTFRLPVLPADATVIILGEGIQEPNHRNTEGIHSVSFAKPWLGSRQFRIEYEVPHAHGPTTPIPSPFLDGGFGGERFLVLQSRGAVEVLTTPSAGLAEIDWDDIPDFATSWSEGRVLDVYRYRERGEPGTFRTVLHESAPILSRLAQTMELTTIIGAGGTTRTEAEFLLAYSRSQYLTVELPLGSRVLAARINGEPVRSVRSEEDTETRAVFSIPLPPQSYARVTLTYEQATREGGGGLRTSLGSQGTWQAIGPTLRGIPIGETSWRVFHPEGYRFYVTGGNLQPTRAADEYRVRNFADAFFGNLGRGRAPQCTVLRTERPVRRAAQLPALTAEELEGAERTEGGEAGNFNLLRPEGQQKAAQTHGTTAPEAPLYRILPQGRFLQVDKVGGAPTLELSYQTFALWEAAKRGVFLTTLLVGMVLLLQARRTFWRFVLVGIALGTLVPIAMNWESPLLMIPFCEGLVVLAMIGTVSAAIGWIGARLRKPRLGTASAPIGIVLLSVLSTAAVGGFGATGLWAQDRHDLQNIPEQAQLNDFDVVWIPYNAEGLPAEDGDAKAYISRERFRELWKLAHPEDEKVPEFPHAFVLGPAEYTLAVQGESFRLVGTIPLYVFSERWITVQLPFQKAQPTEIRLDGIPLGVSQKNGSPFVEIKGQGRRQLEVFLEGRVTTEQGRFLVESEVLPGTAVTIVATLPAGAEVKSESSPLPFVEVEETRTVVTFDAGLSDRIRLLWSIPQRGDQQDSQVESLSYTALSLEPDGMGVGRRERLTVKGQPVDQAQYRVAGNWEVAEVVGPELAEWSVAQEGEERILRVFFSRPVSRAELGIYGQLVADSETALPTLVLEGAARAEAYVAIHHGSGRRFLPNVLTGMERASYGAAQKIFSFPQGAEPDRVYHAYGTAEGEVLRMGRESEDYHLQTDAVLVIRSDRHLLFGRARFTKTAPGPLRYEVLLPDGFNVRKTECDTLRSWDATPEDGRVRLVVELGERATTGTEVVWSAEQLRVTPAPDAPAPDVTTLPFLATSVSEGGSVEQSVRLVIAAEEGLELRSDEITRWEPLPLDQAPDWVALSTGESYRLAYRSKRTDSQLTLGVTPRGSELSATAISIARASDEALHVNARIVLRLRSGSEDRFRLRLPIGALLESLETKNQQSRSVADTPAGVVIDVTLQSAAVTDHTLDLVYSLPREANAIPSLLPIVVETDAGRVDVDAYVAVVRTARTVTLRSESAGLTPIELARLPYVPSGVSDSGLAETYRATTSDWALRLVEQEIELAASFDAVIELIDMATLVGGDGTRRTRVTYTLRKGGLQFLGVRLPVGAELWGVTVNGRGVSVGHNADGDAATGLALRVPVDETGKTDLPVEVRLYYEEPPLTLPELRGDIELAAPRLLEDQTVQVVKTLWSFQMPGDYAVSEAGGNMRLVPTSLKHAEKVKQLLDRKAKVLSVAKNAESKRERTRAQKDLARLEQSLGDNLAELVGSNRSFAEKSQVAQIGERDLNEVWLRNDDLILNAQGAQQELRQARESQLDGDAPSADEQAFRDRYNFRAGRDWSLGKTARKKSQPTKQDGRDVDSLLESAPFSRWRGLTQGVEFGKEAVHTDASALPAGGLQPLRDAGRKTSALALDTPTAVTGHVTYTFRHVGRDATVRLTLTKKQTVPRVAAVGLLAVAAIAGLALSLRRRR